MSEYKTITHVIEFESCKMNPWTWNIILPLKYPYLDMDIYNAGQFWISMDTMDIRDWIVDIHI